MSDLRVVTDAEASARAMATSPRHRSLSRGVTSYAAAANGLTDSCGGGNRFAGGFPGRFSEPIGTALRSGPFPCGGRGSQGRRPALGTSWNQELPAGFAAEVLAAYRGTALPGRLTIRYPLDEAVFPPDIVAPAFDWQDHHAGANAWVVSFDFPEEGLQPVAFACETQEWTPADEDWEAIKRYSLGRMATVTILGVDRADPARLLSGAEIKISTSPDEVGAPLFFREVNLPFAEAVKDPAKYIRWRFGPISSKEPPPIVLDKLPVCGNCHSFSRDGSTFAMEVDAGNDKGSYTIAPMAKEIVLDPERVITWADYRREDGDATFGMLCQVSPDGRYVVGTVKDRALAVDRPDLAFSQLFFAVKGMLAIYDRERKTFAALPGADDPEVVQTNATWSPDGKYIVFAAASMGSTTRPNCGIWIPSWCLRSSLRNSCPATGSSVSTCTAFPSTTAREARPSRSRARRITA